MKKIKSPFHFTPGGIYWTSHSDKILLLREISALKEKPYFFPLHKKILWDNRFWIDPEIKKYVPRETFIAPLGRPPGFKKNVNSSIPSPVWATLPALWIKGKVVSVPHLGYNIMNEMDLQKFFYLRPLFHDSLRFII